MHHAVLERWSRGESWLHRRDARAKIVALLFFLALISTSPAPLFVLGLIYFALMCAVMASARIPVGGALARSGLVLPFSLVFALMTALAGNVPRALDLLIKSYLSALAVLSLVATTPLPRLLNGMQTLGAPRFLLLVAQFLYRYLFVISEEAQHMRVASWARGGQTRGSQRRSRFRAAAGALAVLFGRAYSRAAQIHMAMLARGFRSEFRMLSTARFGWLDALFLAAAMVFPAAIRIACRLAAA